MTISIDYQTITFVLGIGGAVFGIFSYFRNPQIQVEKDNLVTKADLSTLALKFTEFSAAFQAHLLSDQTSFAQLNNHVVEVDKSVVKLTTIIDERIPKKE